MRWLVLFALLVDMRPADACATAPPRGAEVSTAEEEALIVWDPATKIEHFIRRAAFHSTTREFGFLVPTPTVPQLSEVPDHIFQTLANAIRPEVKLNTKKKYRLGAFLVESCLLMKSASKDAAQAPRESVRVLQTANVAGFDATTVEADDATALTKWLGDHGFEATPQLTAWLDRYVQDKWKVTAFVVSSAAKEGDRFQIATRAVKMTFPAERPFYPYREPRIEMTVETNAKLAPRVAERMLRVFFVSNERYAATLADKPWSAKVLQAGPNKELYSPELAAITGPQNFMTVFVDTSSPRQGIEELYFAPSADKSAFKQPPEVVDYEDVTVIPLDLILLGTLIVGLIIRRRLRRR